MRVCKKQRAKNSTHHYLSVPADTDAPMHTYNHAIMHSSLCELTQAQAAAGTW